MFNPLRITTADPRPLPVEIGEDAYFRTFSGNHAIGLPGIDLAAIGHWLARHLATTGTAPRRLIFTK